MMTAYEQEHFYLGHFIQNMAHAAQLARLPHPSPEGQGGPPLSSEAHSRLLHIRQLLIDWPIGGSTDAAGQHARGLMVGEITAMTIVPMDHLRLRALARDALSRDDFWYDPAAPDGLSEYFPGKSLNPDTV